ncbi:MAG: hypothetical protein WCF65_01495 [Parachlamydiaceae bacterium]
MSIGGSDQGSDQNWLARALSKAAIHVTELVRPDSTVVLLKNVKSELEHLSDILGKNAAAGESIGHSKCVKGYDFVEMEDMPLLIITSQLQTLARDEKVVLSVEDQTYISSLISTINEQIRGNSSEQVREFRDAVKSLMPKFQSSVAKQVMKVFACMQRTQNAVVESMQLLQQEISSKKQLAYEKKQIAMILSEKERELIDHRNSAQLSPQGAELFALVEERSSGASSAHEVEKKELESEIERLQKELEVYHAREFDREIPQNLFDTVKSSPRSSERISGLQDRVRLLESEMEYLATVADQRAAALRQEQQLRVLVEKELQSSKNVQKQPTVAYEKNIQGAQSVKDNLIEETQETIGGLESEISKLQASIKRQEVRAALLQDQVEDLKKESGEKERLIGELIPKQQKNARDIDRLTTQNSDLEGRVGVLSAENEKMCVAISAFHSALASHLLGKTQPPISISSENLEDVLVELIQLITQS